ncbi:hypothetical protein MFLAVUS_000039 [Mucor flavus]|uniref:Uncharacterized protein n=1 Tax=Mucor flavus TaxID=439312 RepID=A0ABP9YIK4_9FUNG
MDDPDRLVHLRWTNTTSNEKGKSWPDVVVSETPRLVFGGSAAYGEARTQQGSRSKLLCLDTLRLAISTKKIKTVTFPSRTDNFAEELIGVANGLLDLVDLCKTIKKQVCRGKKRKPIDCGIVNSGRLIVTLDLMRILITRSNAISLICYVL